MESLLNRYRNITVLLLAIFTELVLLALPGEERQDVPMIRVWAVGQLPVACAGPAAARGHPAQLLGSLVEQEGLSGHVVSLHTTDASTRAHKQVKRGGRWQIVAMKRRWPGGLSGPMRNSADRYRAVVGKAPKKTRFAAQLPHVTPSKGRSARMPTSVQSGHRGAAAARPPLPARCCAATAAGQGGTRVIFRSLR